MSKKHTEAVQRQFTKTAEAFSTFAMRDTPEVLKEKVDFAKPLPTDAALDIACGPRSVPRSGSAPATWAPSFRKESRTRSFPVRNTA